jgi:hypothetical protein
VNLKTGTYRPTSGTRYARFYIVIANQNNRIYIKIVTGNERPYGGFLNVRISSVSSRDGEFFIDSTDEEIKINSSPQSVNPEGAFHFTVVSEGKIEGVPGYWSCVWQHMKDDFEPDTDIDECLSSSGKYEKVKQGKFIPGIMLLPEKRYLTAQTPDAQINVRTGAGTSFDSHHYGVIGDEVTLIEGALEAGSENIWYEVKFTGSDIEGWIRSDFIASEPN